MKPETNCVKTAFEYAFSQYDNIDKPSLRMTRLSACMVFLIYIIYILHELRRDPLNLDAQSAGGFDAESVQTTHGDAEHLASSYTAGTRVLPPRTIRFADENSDSFWRGRSLKTKRSIELEEEEELQSESEAGDMHEEQEGESSNFSTAAGRSRNYQPLHGRHRHSRSLSLASSQGRLSRASSVSGISRRGLLRSGLTALQAMRDSRTSLDSLLPDPATHHGSTSGKALSIIVLVVSSIFMSMCAECLVETIDDVTHQSQILSEAVIGLILLPVVGNMSEYFTVVTVAARNKLDLAIAVSIGSSIQIALCVTPLTVLVGWILNRDLELTFNFFEISSLVGTTLLVNLLVMNDGSSSLRTCGLKGGLMCACYCIVA